MKIGIYEDRDIEIYVTQGQGEYIDVLTED